MGEASGGRSATSPTFFKSTSVRTRIEWQNSQVVWTALDQRNFTGAPQLGQLAPRELVVGGLMFRRAAPPGARKRAMEQNRSSAMPQSPWSGAAGNRTRSGRATDIR